MKGILKRWIALSLSFMLMCAAIPVRAQENEMDVQAETQTMESEIEQRINFVYIESPYLETSKTQKMVVSWGDGTEEIESITANLTGESGTEEWEATQHSGNLYLFEKEFSEDQNGTYEVTELNVKTADATQTFALADLGIAAEFGVNETYDGIEELKPLDAQETQELETSVVMIDQNGETEVHDGISEALREVSREMEGPSAKMRAASVDSRDSEIVVALDPGHDSSHSGASANGLREEVLTLKIANYCKTELEQYEGVRVYMTRTGAACPYPESTSSGDDIDRRAKAAAKQGARIFVSFHLNSSTASSAKGAEVIYPNSSWKPQVGADGKALATAIWDELGKLGLEKRPIYSKNTTLDEKYPDGSISDYFSVQISCKEENIPGIIVEHAFISNSSDAENFLKTEAGLKKLGVADATGIAKFLGLKKESSNKNGWITEGGQKYYYVNGEKASGWKTIGGKRYYFIAPDYHMHTGWLSFGSTYYYMMSDGHMHTGWLSFGSTYYYLNSNGVRVTGWQTIDGKEYYFDENGIRRDNVKKEGWQTENGKRYYYKNGVKVTGWQTIGGKRYYFIAPDYHMHTGWLSFGSTYYYMMSDGHMHTGWLSFGSTYYYLNSNGVRVTGWQTIDGKEYYFDENGIRRDNVKKEGWQTENGKRYYYKNGVKVTGWQTIGGKRYYFIAPDYHMHTGWLSFGSTYYYMMSDGHMHTGWLSFGSTYYYLNSNGVRVTGWQTIGGKKYYFAKDGKRQTGWQTIDGKRYYFIAPDYHMHTGWLSFGSTYYYMMSDGHMHTGWLSFGSTYYYLNSNGVRVTGWQIIGGKKYYFAKDGKRQTGWQTIDGKRYYFIAPDYHMHTGWLSFGSTYYYLNSNGVSVTGWQTIDGKEYYFDENGIRRDAVKKEGWQTENGKRYYYRNGVKVTGWQTIGGKRYYFIAPDYHMHTGWLSFGSTYYYMMSDGHMHTGWLSFGSTYYYLNSNGVRVTGWQTIGGVRYYFDSNGVRAEYYNIEGKTQTTVSQMVKFYQKSGKRYPSSALGKGGASTIQSFCQLYYEEAAKEGIRAEVAFAQAMEETGWLQYGGDVKIEQFNFAGLGATGGGVRGESFKDVRTGIRAQIQHLKAYASTKPLNGVCVDNRFKYVKRGCAPYVEILGIPDNPDGLGWAAKKGYGFDIRGMIDVMLGL